MTAATSYAIAQPVAERWAADAQLIGMTATWSAGRGFQEGVSDWSLMFHSPSRMSTALISIVQEQATLIETFGDAQEGQIRQINIGQLDSPQAVDLLLANGGDEFLRSQPDAKLILSLHLVDEALWKARLIDPESRRTFSIHIDATNGDLIELTQSR